MANPIHCDATDCPELADVLVSRIANGPAETTAWCDPHYLEVCQAIAEAIAAAEAALVDQEAEARLTAAEAHPTESVTSSDVAPADPDAPGLPEGGPLPAEPTQGPAEAEAAPTGRPGRAGRVRAEAPAGS